MANDKYVGKTGVAALEGVSYSRSVTANTETKVVEVVHVTTCEDGQVYVTTKFDFSAVDENDLLECAARHLVIACRAVEYRTITTAKACETDGQTLDPTDYIKRERKSGPVTPEKLVDKLFKMGISEEEITAMIAARTAADKASAKA